MFNDVDVIRVDLSRSARDLAWACALRNCEVVYERYNELWYSPDGATAIRDPFDAFAVGGIDNRSKNKRGTLCYVAKCNNFGGHNFPSEATAKNAWIKWLDEPEKRKFGCRWQFHAVGPRSSLPHPPPKSNFGDCSQWAQPSGSYVGPICLGANESHIYPNMCAIFGCGPTVVSREKRGTDSWHE